MRSMKAPFVDEEPNYRSLSVTETKTAAPAIVLRLKKPTPANPAASLQQQGGNDDESEASAAVAAAAREQASALASALLGRRDPLTGWSILHYLAALGADRELAALLDHPLCPIDAISPPGVTALDLARMRGHRVAARLIFCAQERRRRPGSGGNLPGSGNVPGSGGNVPGGGQKRSAGPASGKAASTAPLVKLKAAVARLQRTLTWLAAVA